jgi:hypothetical protein
LIAIGIEFAIRYKAIGKKFFQSTINVIDTIVVCVCAVTFAVLLTHSCGDASAREAVLEETLLLVRNGIQLVRLVMMMRRFFDFFILETPAVSGIHERLIYPMFL